MGSFPVLVPPAPGLLCAIGDLVADFRDEFAQTYIRVLGEADPAEVGTILDALGERATEWLDNEGIPRRALDHVHADMRYHRQGYEIPVAIDPDEVKAGSTRSRSGSTAPRAATGSACRARPARSSTCGRSARAPCRSRSCRSAAGDADASGAVSEEHEIVFKGERLPTKIYDRAKLAPGNRFDGPAIVTEFDSTTVVLPGYAAEVDVELQHPHQPEGVGGTMATITTDKPQIAEIPTGVEIDPVTLDIIEGALKSTRYEMDAVLFRSAMSP